MALFIRTKRALGYRVKAHAETWTVTKFKRCGCAKIYWVASNLKQLRLQNLAPLEVGGQMTFAYDVIVLEPQLGEARLAILEPN